VGFLVSLPPGGEVKLCGGGQEDGVAGSLDVKGPGEIGLPSAGDDAQGRLCQNRWQWNCIAEGSV